MKKSALILACLLLVACVATPPAGQRDTYHQLPPPAVDFRFTRPLGDSLVVRRLRSDGLREERALLYSEDAEGLGLYRFQHRFWPDPPPRMVEHRLVEVLRAAGAAAQVGHWESGTRARYSLCGRLLHFELVRAPGQQARVRVALELHLEDRGPGGAPRSPRTYRAEVPLDGGSSDGISRGFGRALDRIFSEFLQDLSRLQ